MPYRHEIAAIIAATRLAGGPLTVLGEVLDRRARAGVGLSPDEVQAAARLIAAARQICAASDAQQNDARQNDPATSGSTRQSARQSVHQNRGQAANQN